MSSEVEKIAASLEREGEKTLAFFDALGESDWDTQIYTGGDKWTVHHLLAHFVEVEGSIRKLIARIIETGEGVPEDFDIDRWNARYTMEMSEHDRHYLLKEFKQRRAATVKAARSLKVEDLDKDGRHPFLGPSQVRDMLRLMYLHLKGHQRDIQKVLDGAEPL